MKKACILVLENLRSVENTASIFRTADGLGASKIYLIGTTPQPIDRFGRKRADFAKVSLGAEEMEWEYSKTVEPILKELKSQGYKIISLEQHERSAKLHKQEAKNLCLIVGNEVDGVSKEALELSDEILEIEMQGEKESLNAAVATGIALYELNSF
jgi:23S rRNA (guanosine2251-2'-O)-methyltransferase